MNYWTTIRLAYTNNITELQVTKQVEVGTSSALTLTPTYQHFHPAKQSSCIHFPENELNNRKDDYIETQHDDLRDDECIVIALYRDPVDVTQCDYVCLYGHTKVGGVDTPYIGLPSKGIVSLGHSVEINKEASFGFQATIQRTDQGGVAVTTTNFVEPIIKDGSFQYEVQTNWNQTIPQSGSWVPVKYNYSLSFQIQYTLPGSSIERIYNVVIGSDVQTAQTSAGLVYRIPQLQFMWGCLAEGTLVRMFDQTEKKIEDIIIGDNIMGRNRECVSVVNVWKGMETNIIRISTDVGEISMTHHHPVMINYKGVLVKKIAALLKAGDELIDYQGSNIPVRAVTVLPYRGMVYNLTLDAAQPYFIANGIVVGDMTIQNS
ncbi:MAG: Hint domain-containing protein [Eubacteriales bacterium]